MIDAGTRKYKEGPQHVFQGLYSLMSNKDNQNGQVSGHSDVLLQEYGLSAILGLEKLNCYWQNHWKNPNSHLVLGS